MQGGHYLWMKKLSQVGICQTQTVNVWCIYLDLPPTLSAWEIRIQTTIFETLFPEAQSVH